MAEGSRKNLKTPRVGCVKTAVERGIPGQGAYLDYVGAPLAAAAGYGKEQGNPMAAGYQAGLKD